MTRSHRFRWLQFRISTLLLVVTALCCWLGWETYVVRERRAALREIATNRAFQVTTAEAWAERYPKGRFAGAQGGSEKSSIRAVRTWLGDEAIQSIEYTRHYEGYSDEMLARLQEQFPEAEMVELLAVPCHPGCFPRGTLVDTPHGPRAVETIVVGDAITVVDPTGTATAGEVESIFTTTNLLWRIEVEGESLFTTEVQPLCKVDGTIVPAGELVPGDQVLRYRDGKLTPVEVVGVAPTARHEEVFNLVLGDSQMFVAGGFLARSKPPAECAD